MFTHLNVWFDLVKHTNIRSFSDSIVKLLVLDQSDFNKIA